MQLNHIEKLFYLSISNVSSDELEDLRMMLQVDLRYRVEIYSFAVDFANRSALSWSTNPQVSDSEYIKYICETVKGHLGRPVPIEVEVEEPYQSITTRYLC